MGHIRVSSWSSFFQSIACISLSVYGAYLQYALRSAEQIGPDIGIRLYMKAKEVTSRF